MTGRKTTLANPILMIARNEAEKNALDLLAYSSTVFPREVSDLTSAKLLAIGVSFAANARRCFEVDGQRATIVAKRWDYSMEDGQRFEEDLWRALNGIIHARSLKVYFAESPQVVFQNSRNFVALHFVYETDRYEETHVDIFGLAWCFLTFGKFAWECTG